jgi:hypothetical protein
LTTERRRNIGLAAHSFRSLCSRSQFFSSSISARFSSSDGIDGDFRENILRQRPVNLKRGALWGLTGELALSVSHRVRRQGLKK